MRHPRRRTREPARVRTEGIQGFAHRRLDAHHPRLRRVRRTLPEHFGVRHRGHEAQHVDAVGAELGPQALCKHQPPGFARRVVRDPDTLVFSAQVWQPDEQYAWRIPTFTPPVGAPLVYEAHVGMAQEKECVGNYREFAENIIPRIKKAGYNTIQLMAIQQHPYYG